MRDYVKELISTFPEKLSENMKYPWTTRLFNINDKTKLLDEHRKDVFHTNVVKCMFLAKRAKPDILLGISFLRTQVMKSNEKYWKKLVRIISYLKKIKEIVLYLKADNVQELKWYVDSSLGTHKDMKSNTRSAFTLGNGAIWNESTKQKVNARSSTEAELISIDNNISKIICMERFIESQGFDIDIYIKTTRVPSN